MKIYCRILLSFLLAFPASAESPTGKDLIKACEHYLKEQGNNILTDMMCLWYVTPCDCTTHYKEMPNEDMPGICLPSHVSEEQRITLLLNRLNNDKSAQQERATVIANKLLSEYYPCDTLE